jgi:glycerol-3-phosphate dehydrogenase
VLAHAASDPAALERIHPGGPDIWAQVRHATACELAVGVDDVVDRRTTLGWRGLADETTRERIARVLLATPVPA